MVPIAQSSTTMRRFNSARNSDNRACLSSFFVPCRTIKPRSIRSTCDAYSLEHVPCEVGGAGWRHNVCPADEGLRIGEQLLGDLDTVLRGVPGRERGELLADVPRDVYPWHLVVEKLRLPGAPERHEA